MEILGSVFWMSSAYFLSEGIQNSSSIARLAFSEPYKPFSSKIDKSKLILSKDELGSK